MAGFEFPAFLRLEHRPDASAKTSFLAEVASINADAQKQFERSYGEISKTIERSLTSFSRGGLRFDVDVSGLRQAAAEADFTQQRLIAMRDAAVRLASATKDTSEETRRYIQALSAQVIEADQARAAADAQVTTYSRLQGEIDRTISSNDRLAASYRSTFAEQARQANAAFDFQRSLNASYGLSRTSTDGYDAAPAKSARESASAFQELFAAQDAAAASAKQYAAAAQQLRAQLDPALAIQQKFDAELRNADTLLAAGAINQREYAQAATLAHQSLSASWSSLTGTQEENIRVTKRGTTESGNVINGIRAQRFAFIQLGQQMQDVVVQTQSGTSAVTIFTQQVPQMAFALSGLADSTNKTYAKVGQFATFLSGVGGAAIFGATALLAPLIARMIDFGDEADDAKGKTYDFAKSLDIMQISAGNGAEAMRQLAEATRGAIAVQGDFLNNQATIANQSVESLQALIQKEQAELADLRRRFNDHTPITGGLSPSDAWRMGALEQNAPKLQASLASAQQAKINAEIAVSQRRVNDSLDAGTAATHAYEVEVGKLNERLRTSNDDPVGAQLSGVFISQKGYEAEYARITKIKNAAIKAAQDAKKASDPDRTANDVGTMKALLKQLFGAGTYIGDNSKHSKYTVDGKISDHYGPNPRALDFVPQGGMGKYSKAEAEQMLKDAGVDIRRNDRGTEQFFGPGDKGHSNHFHVAWQGGAPDPDKVAAAAQKAQQALDQFGARAGESIQRVNERFNEQPRLIDSAAAATRDLDATIAELSTKKPPNFEALIASALDAKSVIQDALVRPFRQMREEAERRAAVDNLLSQGRDAEARATEQIYQLERQIGPLTAERKNEVLGIAKAEQAHVEALQRAQEVQSAYLDATRSVRSEVEAILGGYGKISNFKQIFQQLRGKILAEQLFGDVFRDMDKWVKEKTGIGSSVDAMGKEVDRASAAIGNLADVMTAGASRIAGGPTMGVTAGASGIIGQTIGAGVSWPAGPYTTPPLLAGPGVANDNAEIVVNGKKPAPAVPSANTIAGMTPERYAAMLNASLAKPLLSGFDKIFGTKFLKGIAGPIGGALEGFMTTGTGFGAVLGGLKDLKGLPQGLSDALGKAFKGAQTGAAVSGIGNALGIKMSTIGAQAGGALGSLLPIPGGDIIGSIAGGLLGALFSKKPHGSGSVTNSSVGVQANDNEVKSSLDSFGTSVQSAITNIADKLGAEIGNYSVGIGRYKDYYQVSSSGSDPNLGKAHYSRDNPGTSLYDGLDAEEAMRAAIKNAIADGAIQGVRASTQVLLKAGKDIEAQIQKAVDFEGVFKTLKQHDDPVGAALDELDAKFKRLQGIFKEAGASTAEYADLERLYGIERADAVKQANAQIVASLKSLYDEITVGNDAYSLRDRKAQALATYQPLEARVKAGDTSAYDDYATAARQLLDIERQMSGSQGDYFALVDEIKTLTKGKIDSATVTADASANRDSPFTKTGTATAPANDNASITSALDGLGIRLIDGLGIKLDAVNQNLGALILQGGTGSGSTPSWRPGNGNW